MDDSAFAVHALLLHVHGAESTFLVDQHVSCAHAGLWPLPRTDFGHVGDTFLPFITVGAIFA